MYYCKIRSVIKCFIRFIKLEQMNNVQNGQCLYYAMSCSTEKILKISPEADLSL